MRPATSPLFGEELYAAAARAGIELEYEDVEGRMHAAPDETLRAILASIPPPEASTFPTSGLPERAYFPDWLHEGVRTAGVAISLYGLRSGRNWGVGDATDLGNFAEWAARATGASFIALNPLHAIPNRQPYNTSPYLPTSVFWRNPLYIDVDAVPEFDRGAKPDTSELRDAEFVEYELVWKLKRFHLKRCFRRLLRSAGPRWQAFQEFVEREGELLDRFAVFCALDEWIHRRSPSIWLWTEWPPGFQHPESGEVRAFTVTYARRVLFHKYLQFLIDEQLANAHRRALEAGMKIGLYHDLALANDRFGADLWAYREFFAASCRVGAPPDDFAPNGQDWAFPPPNRERHLADNYRLFAATIRQNVRHGGALRIDHVMRFFRLFWIPEGREPADGAYVRDYPENLLRVLASESHRAKAIVIGEDLGTVAEEVRVRLWHAGVCSYRVFYFEHRRPEEFPWQAAVSSTTHDLPTLAGFWIGRDIDARLKAGLVDRAGYEAQQASRSLDKQRLLDEVRDFLPEQFPRNAADVPELNGELHNAVIGFLASTNSALLVLNQEDLTKELDQQNLPASTTEYPNWRRKMRYSIEDLSSSPEVSDMCAMFRGWIERTGRI